MIPKIIHYCWFGNEEKPLIFGRCLESWKKFCPDFDFKEWNENNLGTEQHPFLKNALRKKKYAFVADYVRVVRLYEFGGIYLDTDMLLIKPIDELLKYDFFTGEEVEGRVAYGLFGAIKGHPFLKKMIDFYDHTEFNVFSPPVITHTFNPVINRNSIGPNEVICPPSYFYPLRYEDRLADYLQFIQPETRAVHLWNHSWASSPQMGFLSLIRNLKEVTVDYLLYNYSYAYFKRYFRGFSRQLYYLLKARIVKN